MKLEYDSGTLRVENADGLRWQVTGAARPPFTFAYDALTVTDERALRRAGPGVLPLTEAEAAEVRAHVAALVPPPWATFQAQVILELRSVAHGLISSVLTQLEYDGLLDAVVTGRPDSTDLYAGEARRVLAYVDLVWNAFHGLAARIEATPREELRSVKEYAETMPFPPPLEHFAAGVVEELLHGARGHR
jgi:hypothetical protein